MNRIGITAGDPAGVGPEVLLKALADADLRGRIEPIVFGFDSLLGPLADSLGLKPDFGLREPGPAPKNVRPGMYTSAGGRAQVDCLAAAADALAAGELDGLVTGPIHKRAMADAGLPGCGHTEWLAQRFSVGQPVMMLAGPKLRVVLATTHLPLRKVAGALTHAGLAEVIQVAHTELKRFFVPTGPRLALASLNPHGEEDGRPGLEETRLLAPVVKEARAKGIDISGPIAGDSVFALAVRGAYDAVLALYHDQGLAAVKTLHFAETVNVTLGLGLVRTSPDHGPAYDLAGQGVADSTSMRCAIVLADEMIDSTRSTGPGR